MITRTVLHIDLNTYYVSVEINENPSLKGLAVAVAGDEKKRGGVILTASYEARKYGVKAGMSNRDAINLCPHLKMIPPRMSLYKEYSEKVMSILREYTYKVEQFSIDEAWLDISDLVNNNCNPNDIAFNIKEKIKKEVGVTVSVGISYNKVLAKLASDIAKKDSIYGIDRDKLKTVIWKKPVKDLFGVGSKTYAKLKTMNIYTIGDLAKSDKELIKTILKKPGVQLWEYANGYDLSPVNYIKSYPKSIGNSHTFVKDITSKEEAKKMLLLISEQVGLRLRNYRATASVISVAIKTSDFVSFTRQKSLQFTVCTTNRIYQEACKILEENWDKTKAIRLLGVSLSNIKYYEEQLSFSSIMNDKDFRDELVDITMDNINKKYKKQIITRAILLEYHKMYSRRIE